MSVPVMSMNTGNNVKIGMDNPPVVEKTNGDPSIGSQTKLNQDQIAAEMLTPPPTSTATMTTTQTKEEPQTKPKHTSTPSNTDSTQNNGIKSGGTPAQPSKSKFKRFSTMISKTLNLGNRNHLQQGRYNNPNELHEDMESQDQDNSVRDSHPRPEQGEKIPEQDRATDLSPNSEDLPTGQYSVDNTKRQQDRHQDDYVLLENPELNEVSKHEIEIASLKSLVADHTTEIASLKKLMVENGRAIASLKAQLSQNVPGSPTPNDQVRGKPVLKVGVVTASPIQERPEEDLVFRKADGISLTEVANLVKELNAQIDQAASLIMDLLDLLPSRESSSSGKNSEIAWDELHDYLGSWLCNELQEPEIDQTVAHIALQAGLVHACSRIINDWNPPFWTDGEAFSRVYNNMAGGEGPITADTWRALARNYMAPREDQLEANKKYLEEVFLKLIIAVSGSLESGEMLLQKCNEKVDDITRKAIDIHRVISREARSTDLATFTIDSGADFDQSRMEDTEESNSKVGPTSPIVCTVEMGLRGRKRVPSRQQNGDGNIGEVGSVTLKAKVVLSATLSEL